MDVNPSLDDELAALEGSDPAVQRAVDRLDEATTRILSTSGQLRDTQRALAASQADLTRVERERDDAVRRCADLEQVREELRVAKLLNESYREDIQDLTRERDDARADERSATHLLGRIEKAAGAEDTDPFTDLAEFVRGLRVERDLARAELASARTELEQLRGTQDTPRTDAPGSNEGEPQQ